MRLVCISDTHGDHENVALPEGDVLIHAGDVTGHGTEEEYVSFVAWLASQPHEHKIFIAGNHDTYLESNSEKTAALAEAAGVTYLNDSGCTINGVKFWGSPITPRFFDWSFMRNPGSDIEQHWLKIPTDTKVVVTHGPPYGILDQVERSEKVYEHTGCPSLLAKLTQVNPKYHIFGHIHEGFGEQQFGVVRFVNASSMNKHYQISNPATTLDID